tara:strand:+ start:3966 stop:4211 length:246 start_codon:yes stop_codon:yes gene_type:complete
MVKKSPVAIFMAATALLATSSLSNDISKAGENHKDLGGLKEWTTDQDIEEESTLDEAAKKAAEKAKKADICIPVGEGENCW